MRASTQAEIQRWQVPLHEPVSDEPLLDRFRNAGVPSSPYAYALDPTGESVLGLIEADPWPKGPPSPVLSDEDWLHLQDICTQ